MRKIAEPIKTIIILLLTASMLIMAGRLMMADLFTSGTGSVEKTPASFFTGIGLPFMARFFEDGDSGEQTELSESALIYPYLVAVRHDGITTGACGSESAVLAAYSAVEDYVCEALSQGMSESETPFESLCRGDGIFVDMGRSFSLELMCLLSSGKPAPIGGAAFDRLFVYSDGGGFRAAVTDGRTTYVTEVCDGALNLSAAATGPVPMEDITVLSGLLGGVTVRGGSLMPQEGLTAGAVSSSNMLYSEDAQNYSYANLSEILSAFSINSGSINNEVKDDGSIIYVENLRSIRADTDGSIAFSAYQDNGGVSLSDYVGEAPENGYGRLQVLTAAQRFMAAFDRQLLGGEASVRLRDARYDAQSGGYVVEFEYCVNGLSLGGSADAARLVYRNGNFVSAEMNFRHWSFTGDSVTLDSLETVFRLFAGKNASLGKVRIGYAENDGSFGAQYLFYWEE